MFGTETITKPSGAKCRSRSEITRSGQVRCSSTSAYTIASNGASSRGISRSPLAVLSPGLGERRVPLDGGHAPAALGELPAQQRVRRAHIQEPPAAPVAEPAQDDRVARVRVGLEDLARCQSTHRTIIGRSYPDRQDSNRAIAHPSAR